MTSMQLENESLEACAVTSIHTEMDLNPVGIALSKLINIIKLLLIHSIK